MARKRKKRKNWIQSAVERPGSFSAKAKRAGMSTQAYARRVKANPRRYSSRTVKQANLAQTLAKMRKKRRKRRRRK